MQWDPCCYVRNAQRRENKVHKRGVVAPGRHLARRFALIAKSLTSGVKLISLHEWLPELLTSN